MSNARPKSILLIILMLLGLSAGAVELRFDPQDGTFGLDEDITLSIYLDEALELRTIELRLSFDPDILAAVDGEPGACFGASGCMVFDDFQNDIPGECYGTAITIGYDCWVTGPGELYRFTFHTLSEGFSHIDVDMLRLYNPGGVIIEDATLPGTLVFVGTGTGIVADPTLPCALSIAGNPFRPADGGMEIRFGLARPAAVDLAIFDIAGRLVRGLLSRQIGPGAEPRIIWDGKNDAGEDLPSSVYFCVLRTGDFSDSRKVVLLR